MMCINYGLIQKSLSDPIIDKLLPRSRILSKYAVTRKQEPFLYFERRTNSKKCYQFPIPNFAPPLSTFQISRLLYPFQISRLLYPHSHISRLLYPHSHISPTLFRPLFHFNIIPMCIISHFRQLCEPIHEYYNTNTMGKNDLIRCHHCQHVNMDHVQYLVHDVQDVYRSIIVVKNINERTGRIIKRSVIH